MVVQNYFDDGVVAAVDVVDYELVLELNDYCVL
jgi:hypothetical protein